MTDDRARGQVDVVIVGGGPAGLQAALILGRARRRVVVVDAGEPSHFAADAVHGVLGFENLPPKELRARAWRELDAFDVVRLDGRVIAARATGDGFELELADGARLASLRVLLAGGIRYAPSVDVPGVRELWGTKVFHCPFCRGWEAREGRIAAIAASAEQLEHATMLLAMWTDTVIPICGSVDQITVRRDGALDVHQSGEVVTVDSVLCAPRFEVVDDLPEQLGVRRVANEPMLPEPLQVEVDEGGATSVPGVFACGDLALGMPSASLALASGARAAFGIVRSLLSAPGGTPISR